MNEAIRPQEIQTYIEAGLGLFFIALAFSLGVRKAIKSRDRYRSVWSGKRDNLECAHINHDKSRPEYDTEGNGRTLDRKEHYIDHFNRHGTEGLGLSNEGNVSALWAIWQRLTQSDREDLPNPREVGNKYINMRDE